MKRVSSILFLSVLSILTAPAQDIKSGRVIFYNTENLFDTIKDPITDDAEFTPTGKAQWTSERYLHKLTNISKVLGEISEEGTPIAIGLSEVENKKVSEDLAAQPALRKYDLGVIEQDSPDPRGIDVALLYSKKYLTVTATEFLTVKLPDTDRGTRDILYARGMVNGIEINFFVNHWPSRREGLVKSESRRCAAALVIRKKIEKIKANDPNARIIIMGDFNDNPIDSSLAHVLGAVEPMEPYGRDSLYDLMTKPYREGKFTLKYHADKDVFDQLIVSENLIDQASSIHVKGMEGNIYKQKWLLFDHPKYGEMPNRTYSGTKYYGGFSDHLPVYIDIEF
jgi:hypothetical protein